MDTAQSRLIFGALADGRAYAQMSALLERAVCQITRRRGEATPLLVFEHVPDGDSGVQVVAGGLEPGETPEGAALREAGEETGRGGWRVTGDLRSAAWLNPEHAKRELRHFFHLAAPDDLPDTDLPDPWEHHADDHLFRFRWEELEEARIDWEMDAFLPPLHAPSPPAPDQGATP
ncbi:8-oxo-dGTP pyrophosphatase MutT, NUDIX family [Deinococcus reticulitermitis]|uniref:8-oxo-dGTP pyrophosphatase MutT, NUDIX family n=1 Tax=Deinococcus reticulitermitis TaxID=856736 RepID=A0A1H6YRD1_9DEIO|nr:NUDIX domain-containing protein [Deinococcus reticulitermitis]SEJ39295.1 8-oxo-dGTP pyrophosphatase MutT, NUDIX family [Deinococcus reticulitermitis]